ncbi:MAG: hypothetical protein NVS3B7_12280 [Candidatus Elarobacter sp.]
MMDNEQLHLGPDLLAVMRRGVTNAVDRGAEFVAPPHLLLALLADPQLRPVLEPLVRRETVERGADAVVKKLPEVVEIPEGPLPDGESASFARYDTLAFRSMDGAQTLYLDADAYQLFIEGARRAEGVYRPKHLVLGFAAEAVKDRDLLGMFGADVAQVSSAIERL